MMAPRRTGTDGRLLTVAERSIVNALARRWNDDLGCFFFVPDKLCCETNIDPEQVIVQLENLESNNVICLHNYTGPDVAHNAMRGTWRREAFRL